MTLEGSVEAIGTLGFKVIGSKNLSGTAGTSTRYVATSVSSGTADTATPDTDADDQPAKKQSPAKEWLVAPTSSTNWLITGTADANYLKPDQIIVFRATLDEQSRPNDKVAVLTIVPTAGYQPGITVDDGFDPARPKASGKGAAQGDVGQIRDDAAGAQIVSGKAKVTGKLGSCGKTRLVVAARKEVHVELTETPTIYVALTDPKLMVVGATVTMHGKATETLKTGYFVPDMVTVVLPKPLTGREKPSQLAPQDKAVLPGDATTTEDDASDDKAKDSDNATNEKPNPPKAADDKDPADAK